MSKHKAHKTFGRKFLSEQTGNREKVLQIWNGKSALLATFEAMKIEDDYTMALRNEVRNLRTRLVNMGAL